MLAPGTHLGVYEVVAPIGAGGMGEVYKAKDTRLDRLVAIKVLRLHVNSDPALRERFEREARTVAALNHPHICTLHDVGHQDAVDYLVLEYLDGQTLADRLTKGALPLEPRGRRREWEGKTRRRIDESWWRRWASNPKNSNFLTH
jgi:eukaryotic-like serine/threonine-protein kinase